MNFAQIDQLIKSAHDTSNEVVVDVDLIKERLEQELHKTAEELDHASQVSLAKFLVAIDILS